MRLYASSRRLLTLLAVAAVTASLPAATQLTIAFPDVIGGGGGSVLPLAAVAPLVFAVTIAWCFTARRSHLASSAVRRTEIGDVAVLIGANLLVVGITMLIPHGDLTVARNAAMLTGVSTLVTCVAGPAAGSAAVTTFVLLVLTYGRTAPGGRFVRVLQALPDASWPLGLSAGLTLLACASLCWLKSEVSFRTA